MHYKNFMKTIFAATLAIGCLTYIQTPCLAFTPVTELKDLNDTHWAYKSIEGLIEKYQIMEGFPDKTFKGTKTVSRYELAAALYKVMTKVDAMLSDIGDDELRKLIPTLQDDLKAIAALQLEFKKELTQIKEDNTKLGERMAKLEKLKITGDVQTRFRYRFGIADDTQPTSPLFSNISDGKGGYVTGDNLGDDAEGVYNSPSGNYITDSNLSPLRVKTTLNIEANLTPEIGYIGKFTAFESGNGSVPSGHFGDEGLGAALYVQKSFLKLGNKWASQESDSAGELNLRVGLLNFSEATNTGTKHPNHFSDEMWLGHGYGMVGWGASELNTRKWDNDTNSVLSSDLYKNSVSRFWVGDINASRVDPDSKRYNNIAAPGVTFDTTIGVCKIMVGANSGSPYANRTLAAKGNLSGLAGNDVTKGESYPFTLTSANTSPVANVYYTDKNKIMGSTSDRSIKIPSNLLDLPSEGNDGYGMLGLDFELGENIGNTFFPVRAAVHARHYLADVPFTLTGSRKEISGVLDLGWPENFGMTLQLNSSSLGYDMASMGVFLNNLSGSGLDIGLGSKFAFRNLSSILDVGNVAASNAGLYIVFPDFDNSIPRLMISARQSFGDSLGTTTVTDAKGNTFNPYPLFKDSGLTVSLPFKKIGGLDMDIVFEYSTLVEGALWSANFLAHDAAIYTTYRF